MRGCIHIYCGDGKGKTSAALGLALRASGRGMRVLAVRFLKTDNSGEVEAMKRLPGIAALPCSRTFGFVSRMSEEQKREAAVYYRQQFEMACRMAAEESYDVLIMDELVGACNYGMVPEADVVRFLQTKPEALEVVLTGRNPSQALEELADYVSEIKMKKHPYTKGIPARFGIEY